jgi:glycine cleavage system H protein
VVAVNAALADQPELVNSSPYENGWVFRLQPDDATVLEELLDADAYRELLADLED